MLVPLTVADVMTTPVETVAPDASVTEAAGRLSTTDGGSLVVLEDGRPIGILTESDVVDVVARGDPAALSVRDVMTADPTTTTPDADLEAAARLLADGGVRRLPVCEDGALVGVVSTTDLSYYLPHLLRRSGGWAERVVALGSTTDSTTYDDPDWTFEQHGDAPVSVGDVVRFGKVISEADVRAFADATGDTNRLHLEAAFAERTRFGGRIAHGLLTAGLVSAALARLPGLTIYLSQDLRFLGPVGVGESATAVCEVVADLGGDKFELATTVYDGDGEVVVDGDAVVLMADLPTDGEERAAQLQ